jgi:hypothetical protein
MIKRQSIKKGHHKAGKTFVLLFNRVSMYGPGHPFSVQAVEEFHRSICELLKATSPVVLMHSRGQLLLEDEPLDPSLNYFKLLSHFKKANVSSIAVLRDIEKREIEEFVRIFLDARRYPTADLMKAAAAARKITHLRINHVSYQKVTEDDEVVSKSSVATSAVLGAELEASRHYQKALGVLLDPEEASKTQTEELSDSVLLKLIKDEYDKGQTSIDRLAFVIQRIVTPTEELRRLLPKIRESLIGEGMPLSDFAELIKHLSQVLQTGELVEWVRQGAETIGVDGADLLSRWKVDPAGMALPGVVFDKEITCALLEKEISRSARYGTDLTVITLSMLHVAPPSVGPEPSAQLVEVTTACLAEIRQQLRNADWIGTLDKTLFVAVLPMTTAREAHITARRLLKRINSNPRGAAGVFPLAKIAGAVVRYDPKIIANADAFVRFAQTEHAEMTHRLRNLQEFM